MAVAQMTPSKSKALSSRKHIVRNSGIVEKVGQDPDRLSFGWNQLDRFPKRRFWPTYGLPTIRTVGWVNATPLGRINPGKVPSRR